MKKQVLKAIKESENSGMYDFNLIDDLDEVLKNL